MSNNEVSSTEKELQAMKEAMKKKEMELETMKREDENRRKREHLIQNQEKEAALKRKISTHSAIVGSFIELIDKDEQMFQKYIHGDTARRLGYFDVRHLFKLIYELNINYEMRISGLEEEIENLKKRMKVW